jgi:TonB-dependent siderophore receptor
MKSPRIAWSSLVLATLLHSGQAFSAPSAESDSETAQKKEQEQKPDRQQQEQEKELPRHEELVFVEGRLEQLPTIAATATKIPANLLSTPASVGVVPRFVFERQDARVLGDALRNVSGVNVGTGFGVFDFFVIRGFDSLSGGLVLTDGAAEPEATFYQLYNVEQVEVLKGPAAFLYGGNPLSGAVNLVRKQPLSRNFADFRLSYGRFQTYQGAVDVNVSRTDGQAAFRLNALRGGSDFYRDDKANTLTAVNPAFTWRLNEKTPLTVNFEYVGSTYKPDSGIPLLNNAIPDVPRTRSYQWPDDVSDQEIFRLRVDLASRVNDRLTFRNKFYYTDLDWISDGTLLLGAFPTPFAGVQVGRILPTLDDRQKLAGNQLEAVWSFATGPARHSLLTGFEVSRLGDEYRLDVLLIPGIDLFNPIESPGPAFPLPGQSLTAEARSLVFAPYFVDQISFARKVHLFFGGRYDVLDYDEPLNRTERNTREFSPMVGGIYSPTPSLSLYASAGSSFAPPSTLVVGERRPEESWQVEVGAKKQFAGGKAFAGAAFYHLERDNMAIPDETGVTRQTGSARSRGLELELSAEPLPDWFTFVSYGYNDARLTRFTEQVVLSLFPPLVLTFDRAGNRPAFAPPHVFNFWTMRELRGGFGVGLGGRYVSKQFIAENNAFSIDDYFTLDAMVSYRKDDWRLSLHLKNLTDRAYETRGYSGSAVLPGNPFTLYGAVELSLGR